VIQQSLSVQRPSTNEQVNELHEYDAYTNRDSQGEKRMNRKARVNKT